MINIVYWGITGFSCYAYFWLKLDQFNYVFNFFIWLHIVLGFLAIGYKNGEELEKAYREKNAVKPIRLKITENFSFIFYTCITAALLYQGYIFTPLLIFIISILDFGSYTKSCKEE